MALQLRKLALASAFVFSSTGLCNNGYGGAELVQPAIPLTLDHALYQGAVNNAFVRCYYTGSELTGYPGFYTKFFRQVYHKQMDIMESFAKSLVPPRHASIDYRLLGSFEQKSVEILEDGNYNYSVIRTLSSPKGNSQRMKIMTADTVAMQPAYPDDTKFTFESHSVLLGDDTGQLKPHVMYLEGIPVKGKVTKMAFFGLPIIEATITSDKAFDIYGNFTDQLIVLSDVKFSFSSEARLVNYDTGRVVQRINLAPLNACITAEIQNAAKAE